MIIRPISGVDTDDLRKIHEKYYKHEFTFDDFMSGFISSCVIQDEAGNLVTAGGLRPLTEIVILTNKDCSVRTRREALYMILNAAEFTARKLQFNEIHAFVQDEAWIGHLEQTGFVKTKGKSLVLPL